MLNKIGVFFWRIAGLKTFLAALLIYVFYALAVMRPGIEKIQEISGKPVKILDLQFSYTPDDARAFIGEYNEVGRNFTAHFELIADGLYPLIYTFLFLIMMGWLFKSLFVYGVHVRYIHLLPFLVMLADYGENACIITMLKSFPNFSDNVAWLSSLFTSLKWSLLAVETLIIGAAIWLLTFYRMWRGKTFRS
jgi:hypothetical protein